MLYLKMLKMRNKGNLPGLGNNKPSEAHSQFCVYIFLLKKGGAGAPKLSPDFLRSVTQ